MHPRCARAVSQLVVERQYRQSVSCNVIALADCRVTGGVSGHYSITCSSLVLSLFYTGICSEIQATPSYGQCLVPTCPDWGSFTV